MTEHPNALEARLELALDEARKFRELATAAMAEVDGLRRAMQSRSDIDIAKGILVERHRVDPQRAFNMLVELSQQKRMKLVAVARGLVADADETDD